MSNSVFEEKNNSRGQVFNATRNRGVAPINLQTAPDQSNGLASLQKYTLNLMNSQASHWGFDGLPFKVTRRKMGDNLWKLTVENPKTRKILLEAEGHGDKIFEYEDSLAKMALALADRGLKITAHKT